MMAFLLDTCVLIDLSRGNDAATRAVARLADIPRVCVVSIMELYAGVRSQREEVAIDAMLGTFRSVPVEPEVYRGAGSLLRNFRASHSLEIGDALIAATAEHHGLKLVTLNVKHFPMFKRLKRAY